MSDYGTPEDIAENYIKSLESKLASLEAENKEFREALEWLSDTGIQVEGCNGLHYLWNPNLEERVTNNYKTPLEAIRSARAAMEKEGK